jgi:chromosome segregation ATPase
MKKWMYIIFPGIMLAVFLVIYSSAMKDVELATQKKAEEVAKMKAADEAKKKVAEEKAREDSARRSAERAAEDSKREAEKIAKWQSESKKIQDDIDKAQADSDLYNKEVAALELTLDSLKKSKDKASRESFDLVKQVERAKVARRAVAHAVDALAHVVTVIGLTAVARAVDETARASGR